MGEGGQPAGLRLGKLKTSQEEKPAALRPSVDARGSSCWGSMSPRAAKAGTGSSSSYLYRVQSRISEFHNGLARDSGERKRQRETLTLTWRHRGTPRDRKKQKT